MDKLKDTKEEELLREQAESKRVLAEVIASNEELKKLAQKLLDKKAVSEPTQLMPTEEPKMRLNTYVPPEGGLRTIPVGRLNTLPASVSSIDVPPAPIKPKELNTKETLPDGTIEYRTNGELTLRIYKGGLTEIHENGKLVTKMFSDGTEVHYNEKGERVPPPLPKTEATPPPLPMTIEEQKVEAEYKKLPEADKEKIGWGIGVIGLRIEKAKNEFFAAAFNPDTMHPFFDNKKGTVQRFCKEMRDSFIRDAKAAEQKAKEATSGKANHLMSKLSGWGNIVKYGRMVMDLTGASFASPLRYVMMGGMATARLAEAGKEARLKNEEVIEQTRIQDVEKAYDEAMRIYDRASTKVGGNKEDGTTISAKALKNAYLMEMPKDLLERTYRDPSVANTLIQEIVKFDLGVAIHRLDDKIHKIEQNEKLSPEEKTKKTEALLLGQRKNLEDYDRILTQYGTVDELAMYGRYAQTIGKTVVAVATVETLLLSAEKVAETISNIWNRFHDAHEVLASNVSGAHTVAHAPHGAKIAESIHAPITGAPQAINNFTNESIEFKQGKGGIQGVWELLKHKDPNTTYGQAIEKAKELGLYNPDKPDESALIREGSTLKLDNNGNLIFHDAKTGEDVTHFAGKMLDTHHHEVASVKTEYITDHTEPVATDEVTSEPIHFDTTPAEPVGEPTPSETPHLTPPEHTSPETSNAESTYHEPTEAEVRKNLAGFYKNEVSVGTEVGVGSRVRVGQIRGIGDVFLGRPENQFLHNYESHSHHLPQEFAKNPFHLSSDKLTLANEANQKNIDYLFVNRLSEWDKLSTHNAKEILKYTGHGNRFEIKLAKYLHLLKDTTGVKTSYHWWGGQKNTSDYIAEALQKAAEIGKLDEIRIRMRE